MISEMSVGDCLESMMIYTTLKVKNTTAKSNSLYIIFNGVLKCTYVEGLPPPSHGFAVHRGIIETFLSTALNTNEINN